MDTVFLICAALGATLLVCEVVAGMLGFGHDHDTDTGGVDHDTDGDNTEGHGNSLFGSSDPLQNSIAPDKDSKQ